MYAWVNRYFKQDMQILYYPDLWQAFYMNIWCKEVNLSHIHYFHLSFFSFSFWKVSFQWQAMLPQSIIVQKSNIWETSLFTTSACSHNLSHTHAHQKDAIFACSFAGSTPKDLVWDNRGHRNLNQNLLETGQNLTGIFPILLQQVHQEEERECLEFLSVPVPKVRETSISYSPLLGWAENSPSEEIYPALCLSIIHISP